MSINIVDIPDSFVLICIFDSQIFVACHLQAVREGSVAVVSNTDSRSGTPPVPTSVTTGHRSPVTGHRSLVIQPGSPGW